MVRRSLMLAVAFAVFLWTPAAHAAVLSFVSDTISTSAPGSRATHTIKFTLTTTVPASGSIVITPESAFTLPGAFDYTDMTLSVNSTSSPLASVASATDAGVAVVSGAASKITITLNSTIGLSAGDVIEVTLASTTDVSVDPINPASTGSYRIRLFTEDMSGATVDYGTAMIAVVDQVSATAGVVLVPPILSNGLPSGTVAANNATIELSFDTNELASCRYATSSGVSYDAMTNSFLPSVAQSFYVDLSGFQNNTTYTYYVRCKSFQGVENTSDYAITFTLAPTPISDSSVPQTGSSGNGGIGAYPNGSAVLYLGAVSFSGVSPPGTITVLTDGNKSVSTISGVGGAFDTGVTQLERGVYTFEIYAVDPNAIKTAPFTATLDVQQGSTNSITGIAIPPSVELATSTVAIGSPAVVSGSSIPGSSVEVDVSTFSDTGTPGAPHVYYASSTDSGAWSLAVPGADLSQGVYQVKARSIVTSILSSDFGETLLLGVGQIPSSACGDSKGDLNHDGKINLIDFSIMLTSWGKNGIGDLNCDGTVGLADFSIMLFNWTG